MLLKVDGTICMCPCSEGSLGAGVIAGEGGVLLPTHLAQGALVMAADRDGNESLAELELVREVPAPRQENMIYLSYRVGDRDIEQVLGMDCPVRLNTGEIIPAGRLQLSDCLVGRAGLDVRINDLLWGAFEGQAFDIATGMSRPDAQMTGHFLVRDGIVVGDLAIQTYFGDVLAEALDKRARPLVGTAAWDDQNRADSRGQDVEDVIELPTGLFFPAAFVTTDIPQGALSAFSARTSEDGDVQAEIEDQHILHLVEHAIEFDLAPRHPTVNFVMDWYDHDENAYLWQDSPRDRHLVVTGGLVRRKGLEVVQMMDELVGRPDEC
ncbi:hypothetical protein [Thalassococcus sp. S3]|uniref:hypothetical protein n=1 Tax=Thalassococcus sp. S3 TaxID=2017482 RepID=UPI00102CA5A2|nr:hypothetical protein [Thalassococcus sp. S3]